MTPLEKEQIKVAAAKERRWQAKNNAPAAPSSVENAAPRAEIGLEPQPLVETLEEAGEFERVLPEEDEDYKRFMLFSSDDLLFNWRKYCGIRKASLSAQKFGRLLQETKLLGDATPGFKVEAEAEQVYKQAMVRRGFDPEDVHYGVEMDFQTFCDALVELAIKRADGAPPAQAVSNLIQRLNPSSAVPSSSSGATALAAAAATGTAAAAVAAGASGAGAAASGAERSSGLRRPAALAPLHVPPAPSLLSRISAQLSRSAKRLAVGRSPSRFTPSDEPASPQAGEPTADGEAAAVTAAVTARPSSPTRALPSSPSVLMRLSSGMRSLGNALSSSKKAKEGATPVGSASRRTSSAERKSRYDSWRGKVQVAPMSSLNDEDDT